MNQTSYIVTLHGGQAVPVTCDVMGVSQTGDLLAFAQQNGQPFAIEAFSAGSWKHFKATTIRLQTV